MEFYEKMMERDLQEAYASGFKTEVFCTRYMIVKHVFDHVNILTKEEKHAYDGCAFPMSILIKMAEKFGNDSILTRSYIELMNDR